MVHIHCRIGPCNRPQYRYYWNCCCRGCCRGEVNGNGCGICRIIVMIDQRSNQWGFATNTGLKFLPIYAMSDLEKRYNGRVKQSRPHWYSQRYNSWSQRLTNCIGSSVKEPHWSSSVSTLWATGSESWTAGVLQDLPAFRRWTHSRRRMKPTLRKKHITLGDLFQIITTGFTL